MKKGWSIKNFEEVLEIRNGRNQGEVESDSGEYPIYGSAGNVMGMATDYICEAGTTIIGRKGNINSPIYTETRFWNVDTAFGLAAKDGLDSRFLYFFCLSYDFSAHNRGTTIPSLVKSELLQIPIPVPPLAEQQRIVGILDEAFERLVTAKANAEKNLQNARALFESHLQSVFTQRGPGWVEKKLGDLCEVFADGDWVESKDQSSDGIRLIQTGNVGEGVFKDRAEKARYISEATFKRLRCTEIFKGDCLISRLPDPVGRSCILPDTGERMITAVDCTIVRFDHKEFLPTFFNHYSQSATYLNTVAKECTGTTRSRISRSNLALTPIPVPPLAEQKRLAAELDTLHEETQRLARLYERKIAALEALKKSLLHQAFSGQL